MADLGYTVRRTDTTVLAVDMSGMLQAGWEQWFLLGSDAHFDSPYCDRRLFFRHLDQAVERKAGILHFGDLFDLMQGKFDPRSLKGELRPEYNTEHYLDAVIEDCEDRLRPYAPYIVGIGEGNHETSVQKRGESPPIRRVCRDLGIEYMRTEGWIKFYFSANGGKRTSRNLWFHHGVGGGGAVTRGVIGTNRRNAMLDGADVIATGHIHERWIMETPVLGLSEQGRERERMRTHVQLASYKREPRGSGYHAENQRPPKPLGGAWLRFYYDPGRVDRVGMQALMAE